MDRYLVVFSRGDVWMLEQAKAAGINLDRNDVGAFSTCLLVEKSRRMSRTLVRTKRWIAFGKMTLSLAKRLNEPPVAFGGAPGCRVYGIEGCYRIEPVAPLAPRLRVKRPRPVTVRFQHHPWEDFFVKLVAHGFVPLGGATDHACVVAEHLADGACLIGATDLTLEGIHLVTDATEVELWETA